MTHISSNTTHASVKGADWRIFYTLKKNGDDPGLDEVLEDPGSVGAVAYVRRARSQPDVVTKARGCGE